MASAFKPSDLMTPAQRRAEAERRMAARPRINPPTPKATAQQASTQNKKQLYDRLSQEKQLEAEVGKTRGK